MSPLVRRLVEVELQIEFAVNASTAVSDVREMVPRGRTQIAEDIHHIIFSFPSSFLLCLTSVRDPTPTPLKRIYFCSWLICVVVFVATTSSGQSLDYMTQIDVCGGGKLGAERLHPINSGPRLESIAQKHGVVYPVGKSCFLKKKI